ncbi:MAG: MBL fold metallo-hydrolase [Clostridia bacterium]|nr:MBL fold metallo-hydrolase [Clostridia bacterium]
MKITFLGATKSVTGSNYLVEGAGKKFLVDCGLHQGNMEEELLNDKPFDFDVKTIDFMLLTHAHIDHSGRIPKLYKDGYSNPIYATKATCDLCSIMLPDSGHIQETEIAFKNKKRKRAGKKELLEPLYTAKDAIDCMEIFQPKDYDEIIEITDEISIRFNDAGHMLGSAIIEIWITEEGKQQKIVFSGDLGNNDIPLLSSPTMIGSADYLVMESTYGDRLHMKNNQKAIDFLRIVSETINNGGTVVIPSFAVGRTQEILYEINKIKDQHNDDIEFQKEYETLMKVPVYVDSPLAVSATQIFKKNMNLFSDEIQEFIKRGDNPLEFHDLHFTQTVEDSKALNESDEPCIVISASGMCDVGRIKHHLKHNIWNPKSTILFVGYQAYGTLGRRIVDGEKKVKILGEEFSVDARIEYIEGFSGHADQQGLINFVGSFNEKMPKHIFLIHGETEAKHTLKQKLTDELQQVDISIPKYGEEYSLNENCEVTQRFINPTKKDIDKIELIEKMRKLESEIEDMKHILQEDIIVSTSSDEDMAKLNNKVNDLRKQIIDIMNKK